MTRVGVLTGGGDCPGLDAVIRATVRRGLLAGEHSLIGFRRGWLGLCEDDAVELTLENTSGILHRGGTILGTSRTDPLATGDGLDAIRRTICTRAIDALVVVGGDGTLRGASDLHRQGIPLVAVPKTIDNDIALTEVSIGFQTAVQTATDAIDRLHTTAESHDRVMVVEVMGRNAGWIATAAGMAGGADAILVPERRFDIEEVCRHLRRRHERGRSFSIVVVAEGAAPAGGAPELGQQDVFGDKRLGGIGVTVAQAIEACTGYQSRVSALGHVQRGGSPLAFDRMLGTRFGVAAMDTVIARRFGRMIALACGDVTEVELAKAVSAPKLLDPRLYETAEMFFG